MTIHVLLTSLLSVLFKLFTPGSYSSISSLSFFVELLKFINSKGNSYSYNWLAFFITIVNAKVDPIFKPSEKTLISPPLYSTILWQITSPIPTPSVFLPSVSSSLLNILKSLSKSFLLMPEPVSLTLIFNFSSASLYDATISMFPLDVNFIAFFVRLIRIYFNLMLSPIKNLGKSSCCSSSISSILRRRGSPLVFETSAILTDSLLFKTFIWLSNIDVKNLKVSSSLNRSVLG